MEDIINERIPSTLERILLPWAWLLTIGEITEHCFFRKKKKKKLLQLSEPFLLEQLEIQSDFEEVGAVSELDV